MSEPKYSDGVYGMFLIFRLSKHSIGAEVNEIFSKNVLLKRHDPQTIIQPDPSFQTPPTVYPWDS